MEILLVFALILAFPIVNAQETQKERSVEVVKREKTLLGYWSSKLLGTFLT
ncbi:MAG: hypothetical protein ACJAT6_000806 [Akkermansiaceae bacterium]|jgi:hypothetical protein|tara:strand:+ start:2218 stop:2370 length:153 start_codon:yes stop_codon:yes gene_type:complete